LLFEEITNARLGYASVNFASSNDLGRGPTIHNYLNDEVDPVKHNRLITMHNTGVLKHRSNDPYQHVSLLVKRRVLNVQALAQDIATETYPLVEWSGNLVDTGERVAVIIDGKHRNMASKTMALMYLERFQKFFQDQRFYREAMMAYLGHPLPEGANTYTIGIKRDGFIRRGIWHCAIYDWGK